MSKPKVAFYWCASCGGCEETVVDLAEDILGVVEKVDIVLWPVAMDFKYKDIEAMPDKSIVATFLNGAIRSTEQEEMAHLMRRKSQYLIAYGACAQLGGIPGLANQFPREQVLRYVYEEAPTMVNDAKTRPLLEFKDNGHTVTLPELSLATGVPKATPLAKHWPGSVLTVSPAGRRWWGRWCQPTPSRRPPRWSRCRRCW